MIPSGASLTACTNMEVAVVYGTFFLLGCIVLALAWALIELDDRERRTRD